MKTKPTLGLFQIATMSMGFMGIQMGFALQNGNASRILQNLGADVHQIGWMWIVAPLMGLLVQPLIGHYSDKTWTKLGRRKPYFLIGAILAAIGLSLLPNAAIISTEGMQAISFFGYSLVIWTAIFFLAFMDASFNISMEPFRALVGDLLPESQSSVGFSVQTVLIGIGAVFGSFMPWILTNIFGFNNTVPEGNVAPNVIYSFYIGAIVILISIGITVFFTREYTPKELQDFMSEEEKELAEADSKNLSQILKDFSKMPNRMKQLGAVQFFTWLGLFIMWVYTASAVATHHFGCDPGDGSSQRFNSAADWVGNLFGIYSFWTVFFAFVITPLSHRTSRKFVHFTALMAGALGFFSMYFISDYELLWIPMIGIGYAWASILSMPYALLVKSLPVQKMGVYMGIFNFFIVIPQIIIAIIGGAIVKNIFSDYAIYMLMLAGVFFVIAAILTLRVNEPFMNEKKILKSKEKGNLINEIAQ